MTDADDHQLQRLLGYILNRSALDDSSELEIQATSVRGSGPVTMRKLEPDRHLAPSALGDGLVPIRAIVHNETADTGELMIWIAGGYLHTLEYAWFTGEPPTQHPALDQIQLT